MADLFYSEVYQTVQDEIAARARAGRFSRTTKDIDFMVGKIANVELTAFKYRPEEKKTSFFNIGGKGIRMGGFLPSGEDGYLHKDNHSYRTPPYVSVATSTIADNTRGFLNKATINVKIPTPEDLDGFEAVWFRPGRKVLFTIQYPESAVLGGEFDIIPTETQIIKPDATGSATLNTVSFEGLITSFEYNQQSDGSYEATLHLTGTSNIYTELSMKSFQEQPTQESEVSAAEKTNITGENFYEILNKKFNNIITDSKKPAGQVLSSYLWGSFYKKQDAPKEQKLSDNAARYISLGHLAGFINLVYQPPVAGASIDINNSKSNAFPNLKSADPTRILLWQGSNGGLTSTYQKNEDGNTIEILQNVPKSERSSGFIPDSAASANTQEIYISMHVINEFIQAGSKLERFSLKDFLNMVGAEVYEQTGGVVNLKLTAPPIVFGPVVQNILWTDINFIGDASSKKDTQIFRIPMFANSSEGTVVEEFKISAKLPDSARNLAFVLNEDPELISEAEVAPYVSYMYADEDDDENEGGLKKRMRDDWENKHEAAKVALLRAERELGKSKFQEKEVVSYRAAIQHFLQYPTDKLDTSNLISRPVFDISAELTLDGINGFKYGDVLEIQGIPERYNKYAVFCIISVTHTVDTSGKWITVLRTIMRVRVD